MSDKNSIAGAAPLVVDEFRDRCNSQYDTLKSWKQKSRLILGAVMSFGALLALADVPSGQELAGVLLAFGLLLIAFVVIAEVLANRLESGPDPDTLAQFVTDYLSARDVEIELVTKLASQLQDNEEVLGWVKITVAFELLMATGGVLWLLTRLL